MDTAEYEHRRRAIEAQLGADLQLITAGHQAKLRALEALWLASLAPYRKHDGSGTLASAETQTETLASHETQGETLASAWTETIRVSKARELAELALFIAERVPGGESLRSRTQGYCWAHVANARRVANDLEGADEAFARAWQFWQAGAEADSELLPELRLLDLEASLRRAERRFPEALKLLDQARTAAGEDQMAAGRILLKKEHVFNAMGDIEGALAILAEAAPLVEAAGDPDLLFALRFNMVDDLCHLERCDEAADLLPRVRELALGQRNELVLIRLLWLQSKLEAGQGRAESAAAGLEQVRGEFTARELPYDAALASLDLAVLCLHAGRTAEVRELAVEMEAVFKAKKIRREALAALAMFCKAARHETATVELARRVIIEIEGLRRSASPAE